MFWSHFLFLKYLSLQALFASCIPEIIDLIGTRPKYGGTYKNERGRRHVFILFKNAIFTTTNNYYYFKCLVFAQLSPSIITTFTMLNNHISSTYILISTGAPFSKSLFIYLGQGGRREYYILLGQILKFCHSTTLDETHLLTLINLLLSTFSVSPSKI